jgi:hypothetical protein
VKHELVDISGSPFDRLRMSGGLSAYLSRGYLKKVILRVA